MKSNKSDRPNVAMIGFGIQARTGLLPDMLKQDVTVRAVCDCDATRRENGAETVNGFYAASEDRKSESGACKAVADFREIIADGSIDAVCIATPDHWHAYIAVEAMKAGKDVYCEKPLTYTVEEAKLVAAAQKKYGRVFQTGVMQRSWRVFRDAVAIVRNGFIGEVRYVDCNYGRAGEKLGGTSQPHRFFDDPANAASEGAPNPDVDWNMWLGPAPWSPYSDKCAPRGVHGFYPMFWRSDDNYGTGYNGDWGAHHLDIAQWGLGMDRSGPVEIIRSDEPHPDNPLHGGRRQFGMNFVFKNGTVLHHGPFGVWGTVFYGTDGIVAVNRGKIAVWSGRGVVPDAKVREAIAKGDFRRMKRIAASIGADYGTDTAQKKDDALTDALDRLETVFDLAHTPVKLYRSENHVKNFIDCVRSRKPTISPAETGARAAILCQLCNLSYVYDTGFRWDPAKCTFAKGDGDPSWLRRDHCRNGWEVKL